MVLIGGYTRLSGSGLSITEWKPITGVIPPISNDAWGAEFAKYKQSPEFQKINNSFTLSDFKEIYWVEYLHRLLGRVTGLVFVVPFIYFITSGAFNFTQRFLLLAALSCGALQGLVGWYMVQSGLIDMPHVSHFRLAIHLVLALTIFTLLLLALFSFFHWNVFVVPPQIISASALLIFLLVTQIIFGAFVAGLKGGYIYNSFPLMNGNFLPDELSFHGFDLSNPAIVQFIHRILAFVILFVAFYIVYLVFRYKVHPDLMRVAFILLLSCAMQIVIGIITLLAFVPIVLGMLHQIFAFVVFASALYFVYQALLSRLNKSNLLNNRKTFSV
jgi:cytochrome c oxidase assembly protein subunit 15